MYFTPFSSVFIGNFKQVNVTRVCFNKAFIAFTLVEAQFFYEMKENNSFV